MSIRTNFQVTLSLSENSSELKDLGNADPWKGKNDLMEGGFSSKRTIAGSVNNVSVDLEGLAAARLIGIKSNRTITVKKNSTTGEAWTIKALGTGALEGVMFITTDGITSLYITNTETDPAVVVIFVAGTF